MSIKEFIRYVKAKLKFKNVHLSKSREFSNCLMVSGDLVGRKTLDELVRLGRLNDLEVIADRINVWESEEFFRKYGGQLNQEENDGDRSNVIPLHSGEQT